MLLWRAMNHQELYAFERGEVIKPKHDAAKQVNSWEEPVVCFFGTCNNALHWASPLYGHQYVVGFEVSPLAVTAGWGSYADLSTLDEKEIGRVFVKEYAVRAYSKTIAKCVKKSTLAANGLKRTTKASLKRLKLMFTILTMTFAALRRRWKFWINLSRGRKHVFKF